MASFWLQTWTTFISLAYILSWCQFFEGVSPRVALQTNECLIIAILNKVIYKCRLVCLASLTRHLTQGRNSLTGMRMIVFDFYLFFLGALI